MTNAMIEAIEANKLNPAIGGWSNYHRHSMASQVFHDFDHFLDERATHSMGSSDTRVRNPP